MLFLGQAPSEVFMIPISSANSGELVWTKTRYSRRHELKLKSELVGSLERTSWTRRFLAVSPYGNWIFRPTGFLRTGTEILDSTSNNRIATFKPHWTGIGTIVFADGQLFRLVPEGCWRQVWHVISESGETLLRLRTHEKTVELPREMGLSESRLCLLTIFVWYYALQVAEAADSAAVAVAMTS